MFKKTVYVLARVSVTEYCGEKSFTHEYLDVYSTVSAAQGALSLLNQTKLKNEKYELLYKDLYFEEKT